MQAIRQILDVNNNILSINLPDNFKANKVEVIILPITDKLKKIKKNLSLKFRASISKQTPEKIEFQLKELRNEWD